MFSPFQSLTTGTYTVATTDRLIRCDTSGGNIILNIPASVGFKDLHFFVKKISSDGNNITINAPAGKTIDGAATFVLGAYTQGVWFYSVGDGNYESASGSLVGLTIGAVGTVGVSTLASDTTPGLSLGDVTGVSVSFTMATTGDVIIEAAAKWKNALNFQTCTVGVKVNGTDYDLADIISNNGSGGDYNRALAASGFQKVHLAAGSYTAQMRALGDGNAILAAGSGIKVTFAGTGGAITTTGQEIQKNGGVISTGERDLDFIEGSNVTLGVVDDPANNRTQITIGTASSGADPLDKDWFSHYGFLPANTIQEQKYAFPAFDFQHGCTNTTKEGTLKISPASPSIAGWNLGASYNKCLIILGVMKQTTLSMGLMIGQATASNNWPPQGYFFLQEASGGDVNMFKTPGTSGGWSTVGSDAGLTPLSNLGTSMAFYYDKSTNRLIGWIRWGVERWTTCLDITDSSFSAQAVNAGLIFFSSNPVYVTVPLGIYAQ